MAIIVAAPAALAGTASAAAVVATPAAAPAGTRVAVTATGFAAERRLTVRLGTGAARRIRASRTGRLETTVLLPSGRGERTLVVRQGPRAVRLRLRIATPGAPRTAVAGLTTGERYSLSAIRGTPGTAVVVRASRLGRRVVARLAVGGVMLGRARADRDGRVRLRATIPAQRVGERSLTIRGRRTLRTRFTVLARAPAPAPSSPPTVAPLPTPGAPAGPALLVAAGDIACDPASASFNGGAGTATRCRHAATASLVSALAPAVVAPLGDIQYEVGAPAAYAQSYDPTWGRFDAIARPVVGDAEYGTPGAAGYFAHFGANAGSAGSGYYSYDLGAWHVIALNSQCDVVSCAVGSAQESWLRADLAAHPAACTLAYWHEPRFTSGPASQATETDPLWRALYAAGAEVVLGGHSHNYERFAPQTPDRAADPIGGIRQFVIGTGGKDLQPTTTVRPNSEIRDASTFGVLALTLRPGGFDWRIVPEAGGFTDVGSGSCH